MKADKQDHAGTYFSEAALAFASLVITAIGVFVILLPWHETIEQDLHAVLSKTTLMDASYKLRPIEYEIHNDELMSTLSRCEDNDSPDPHLTRLVCALNQLSYQLYLKEPRLRYYFLITRHQPQNLAFFFENMPKIATRAETIRAACMVAIRSIDHILSDSNLNDFTDNKRSLLKDMRTRLLRIMYLAGDTVGLRVVAWSLDASVVLLVLLYMVATYTPMIPAVQRLESANPKLRRLKILLFVVLAALSASACVVAMRDITTIPFFVTLLAFFSVIYLFQLRRQARAKNDAKLDGLAKVLHFGHITYCCVFLGFSFLYWSSFYSVGSEPFMYQLAKLEFARLNVGALFWVIFFFLLLLALWRHRQERRLYFWFAVALGPLLVMASILWNVFGPLEHYPRNMFYAIELGEIWPLWIEVIGPRLCFAVPFFFLLFQRLEVRRNQSEDIQGFLEEGNEVQELELALPFRWVAVVDASGKLSFAHPASQSSGGGGP